MSLRPLTRSWHLALRPTIRHTSTQHNPPPFPTIPSCPSPTCSCAPMPSLPKGFEIDHLKALNGTMPAYAEQVLICTGKDDWESNIADENAGDNLAADIKELMGRGGVFSDVLEALLFHSIHVTVLYKCNANAVCHSRIIMWASQTPPSHPLFRRDPKSKTRPHISFQASNISLSCRGYLLMPFKRW